MILTILIPVYNQEELVLKALESIPFRMDTQVIIVDDASTDRSNEIIQEWFKNNSPMFGNILIRRNYKNMGCGYCKNWAYGKAKGDYLITLDSDDYLYTEKYNNLIDELYNSSEDIIFVDNDINNGSTWTDETRVATWCYFARNKFLKDNDLTYSAEARRAGDYELMKKIEKVPHTKGHFHEVVYHYNYPREGSIVWNWDHYKKVV